MLRTNGMSLQLRHNPVRPQDRRPEEDLAGGIMPTVAPQQYLVSTSMP